MGMKFALVKYVVLAAALFCLAGCTSVNNAATTGIAYLYVTAQANTTISGIYRHPEQWSAHRQRKRRWNRCGSFGYSIDSRGECIVRRQ